MTKFEEVTNISVRYNEEFVKSDVFFSLFFSQKWRDREILFDVTRNSLKRGSTVLSSGVFLCEKGKKRKTNSLSITFTHEQLSLHPPLSTIFFQLAFTFFHWMKITRNSSTLHSKMWKQLFPWVSASQPLITCSKLTEETLEQGKRYVQS